MKKANENQSKNTKSKSCGSKGASGCAKNCK